MRFWKFWKRPESNLARLERENKVFNHVASAAHESIGKCQVLKNPDEDGQWCFFISSDHDITDDERKKFDMHLESSQGGNNGIRVRFVQPHKVGEPIIINL